MANFLQYLFKNPIGNNTASTMNVLPAALSTLSNLLSLQGNKSSYELYREQAQAYVNNARENAELIKQQGEIALRNLRSKQKLAQGSEIANVGARNGKLSGSNMDVLIRQEKIRAMDALTLQANYSNQVMLEMINGYRQAAGAYGALAAKAGADKYAAMASILKGVETYMGLQVRDAKIVAGAQAQKDLTQYEYEATSSFYRDKLFKLKDKDDLQLFTSEFTGPNSVSEEEISLFESGTYKPDSVSDSEINFYERY